MLTLLIRKILYVSLLCLFVSSASGADGLVVPTPGGGVVLEAKSLNQVGEFSLGSASKPLLAVHPSSPILAGYTPDTGVVFWNLPSMAVASTHNDELFGDGISSISFSQDGKSLFLLSDDLRSVVVFDLAKSEVSGLLPIPGTSPESMVVTSVGLLLGQGGGVTFVSSEPEEGLVAQFKFPQTISSTLVLGERLFIGLRSTPGIWSYQLPSGRALGFVPTEGEVKQIRSLGPGKLFCLLSDAGAIHGHDFQSPTARWTFPGQFNQLVVSPAGDVVYGVDRQGLNLVAVEASLGAELARVVLPSGAGDPIGFSGPVR